MSELVSVIIPTYGGGQYLARAIDSVLAQTYKNIEIIVVDDNGIESCNQVLTDKIMKKYKGYSNIHYIIHEFNRNGAAARNTGFKYSQGTYIALLDDDDVYAENNIESHYDILSKLNDEYALTYCSSVIYKDDKKIDEKHVYKSGNILYEVLMHKVTIGSDSLLIRRKVWEKMDGFDESFKRHQDWEFTARVAANYKIKAVDNIGYIRYLQFRNSPPNVETAKQYRLHYLDKMSDCLAKMTEKQKKNVIVTNRLDISIQYLKNKDIVGFLKDYIDVNPGFRGILFMSERLYTSLKRIYKKYKEELYGKFTPS